MPLTREQVNAKACAIELGEWVLESGWDMAFFINCMIWYWHCWNQSALRSEVTA